MHLGVHPLRYLRGRFTGNIDGRRSLTTQSRVTAVKSLGTHRNWCLLRRDFALTLVAASFKCVVEGVCYFRRPGVTLLDEWISGLAKRYARRLIDSVVKIRVFFILWKSDYGIADVFLYALRHPQGPCSLLIASTSTVHLASICLVGTLSSTVSSAFYVLLTLAP